MFFFTCGFHFSKKQETEIGEDGTSDKKETDTTVMDTSETKTVTSQSIIGQICFDLATLYFYKGNIEKAKNLFETCSSVQVNVQRKILEVQG